MKLVFLIFLSLLIFPFAFFTSVQARLTPNDLYQEKLSIYNSALSKISDPQEKQLVMEATFGLNDLNQTICKRFDIDIARMGAILEEEKRRKGVTKTVVAYGQGSSPLDSAEYYLNYAAEAVAYQKIQDYTPSITGGNLKGGVSASLANLLSDQKILQGKVLRAKAQVLKTL